MADGSLQSADDISRLFAKIIYMAKLCVLHLGGVETSEHSRIEKMKRLLPCIQHSRIEKMKRLLPCIQLDNMNVFSELCRLKSLASRVAMSVNRPPLVAPVSDDGLDIVIRGVRLHVHHIGRVYRRALDACKCTLDELLVGTAVSNVYDDFSNRSVGYQIMAHTDTEKDTPAF